MLRIVGLWAPVVTFMAGVWFLSDDVSSEMPDLLSDKVLHAAAYGAFGLANMRAFHGGFRRPGLAPTLAALGLTVGFGAMDEWRQNSVALRDGSWTDWIADLIGGVAAWLALSVYPFRDTRARIAARDGEQ